MSTAAKRALHARVDPKVIFAQTLADTGNVTASCMISGIKRGNVYDMRDQDPEFKAAWEAALEISVDKLEYVARNRSIQGVREPVYYKGVVVGHVYKPSDRLMELLLKAHRPDKFNPVQKLEHSGGVSVSVVQFGAPGAAAPVTINQAPGSQIEGGPVSEGVPPKLDAAQNDEPPHIAKFSDLEAE